MPSWLRPISSYRALIDLDLGSEHDLPDPHQISTLDKKKRRFSFARLLLICLSSLAVGAIIGTYIAAPLTTTSKSTACQAPTLRKEWRSLSGSEQDDYISAVKCLLDLPSEIGARGTAFDDFAYIHSKIGNSSHGAASFLPWHRYFIHVYERTLHSRCSYNGSLPYWNWALDWKNLTTAPVWHPTSGFGGTGDPSSASTPAPRGQCVTDGPFANTEVAHFDGIFSPHCISRDFLPEAWQSNFSERIRPAAVEEMLEIRDYFSFLRALEDRAHDTIPTFARGDFMVVTAPNDPVFFLHHAQLDRLWAIWQDRDPQKRLSEIDGPLRADSTSPASLSDQLDMHGLAPRVPVREIMDTMGGDVLCYRYS